MQSVWICFLFLEKKRKRDRVREFAKMLIRLRQCLYYKGNSVEIAYISYKSSGRVLIPSYHVRACDFLSFVEYFFLKLPTIFPLYGPKNKIDEKTTSCKKATELPDKMSSLIGQKNIFLPNQRYGIRPLLELVR